MIVKKISHVFFVMFFLCIGFPSAAQDNHFIYIQSDNGKPFYVRMDGKLYSSTTYGYIILSKLKSADHEVRIGFPKDASPEQTFIISVNGENEGYLLKNSGGKWIMENYRTQKELSGVSDKPPVQLQEVVKADEPAEKDVFTGMLAEVIGDSSILKVNHPISVREAHLQDKNTDSVQQSENTITRLLLLNADSGQEMVYFDKDNDDTIRLLVPVNTPISGQEPKTAAVDQSQESIDSNLTITPAVVAPIPGREPDRPKAKTNPDSPQLQARIIYRDEPVNRDTSRNEEMQPAVAANTTGNAGCTNLANEKDFLRLRKRMAGEHDNFKMTEVARRAFRQKCYTTEQIRNLSFLFLDDEGRYQFFDTAYPYVYDSNSFYTLESLLTDSYYIKRFKAMLHK